RASPWPSLPGRVAFPGLLASFRVLPWLIREKAGSGRVPFRNSQRINLGQICPRKGRFLLYDEFLMNVIGQASKGQNGAF
ncbi:MAG: hypothetical protein ACPLPW_08620, partial [bacterium]